jgi:transketolase
MQEDDNIYLVTGDLGYNLFDDFKNNFKKRFINVGAAEQLMLGIGIGLAMEKKIPICYSITPFVIYRPFEFIRNYVDHESIPVKLVGSGRGKDYEWLGWSHWATDDKDHMSGFKNIKQYWPISDEDMENNFKEILFNNMPVYLNLSR